MVSPCETDITLFSCLMSQTRGIFSLWLLDLLSFIHKLHKNSTCNILNTRDCVSSGYPNTKKRVVDAQWSIFQWISGCLGSWWNTVSSVSYISSSKLKTWSKLGNKVMKVWVSKPPSQSCLLCFNWWTIDVFENCVCNHIDILSQILWQLPS